MHLAKRFIALTVMMFLVIISAQAAYAAECSPTPTEDEIGWDVVGTKYEEPARKLIGLDIIKGFDDGSIKPDSDVTRAQFAVIVSKMLRLGDVSPSTTKFKDVPANHWASGAIDLAVGRGIIAGYPDGTFRPDKNVTFAEASAMLMQALGYGQAMKGGQWPSTPIAMAVSAGVTKGVRLAANDNSPRGDVLMMTANAMTADIMEQDIYGSKQEWTKKTDTDNLLRALWDVEIRDLNDDNAKTPWNDKMPVVSDTARFDFKGLKTNEIQFGSDSNGELSGGTYEAVPYFDPNRFMGQKVEVWVDRSSQKVYYIGPSNDQTVYYDVVSYWANNHNKITIMPNPGNTVPSVPNQVNLMMRNHFYDLQDNTKIIINCGSKPEHDTWAKIKDNAMLLWDFVDSQVKVILDDSGRVDTMVFDDFYHFSNYYTTKSGVVKEVRPDEETIVYYDKDGNETTLNLQDDDFILVRNNCYCSEFKDMQPGDIINLMANEDGSGYYIAATGKQVPGKIENVISAGDGHHDVYINGQRYQVTPECTFSNDNNKTISAVTQDDLDDMIGKDAVLYLDVGYCIKHIMTNDASTGNNELYGVLAKTPQTGSYDEVKVTFVNKQGVEQSTTFSYDNVDVHTADGLVTKPDSQTFWIQAGTAATGVGDNAPLVLGGNPGPFSVENKLGHAVFFRYNVDSSGNLKDVYDLTPQSGNSNIMTFGASPEKIDAVSNKSLMMDNGSSYNINDRTIIWDAHDYNAGTGEINNLTTVPWAALDNRSISGYAKVNGDSIDYIVITYADKSLGDNNFGVVRGFTKVDGDDAVVLLADDGSTETYVWDDSVPVHDGNAADYVYNITGHTPVKTDGSDNIKKGDFIFFTLKGYGDSGQQIDHVVGIARPNVNTYQLAHPGDDSVLNQIHSDQIELVKVTGSSSRFIKGYKVDSTTGDIIGNESYFTSDSNTKYFDIHDTGDLKTINSVSAGDLIVLIDTDDDGSQMDYVVKVAEN